MPENTNQSPDIFISYAHVDNLPLPGAEKGWVHTFVKGLQVYLNRQMGRADNYHLWMDRELRGNEPLTPDILDNLKQSKTFVLFLSPAYIASDWCCDELQTFLQAAKISDGRVFVIELDSMAQQERPEALGDLLGYRFWYKNDQGRIRQYGVPKPKPAEEEYYNLLLDISYDLSNKIKELQKISNKEDEKIKSTKTVFLAPVSDQLESMRNRVVRFLDQHHIAILPKTNCFRLSQDSIEDDFSECSYFIQLLDENSSMGVPHALHDLAEKQALEIVEWRDIQLDVQAVESADQQALLMGVTVIASHLSEFLEDLADKLQPKTVMPDELVNQKLIFLNAGAGDITLLDKIATKLEERGIPYLLPMDDLSKATPAEVREDMEDNLQMCDSMLLLYHKSPSVQIREFLKHGFKINSKRKSPLKTTICKFAENKPIRLGLPHIKTLECGDSFDDCCLDSFLARQD